MTTVSVYIDIAGEEYEAQADVYYEYEPAITHLLPEDCSPGHEYWEITDITIEGLATPCIEQWIDDNMMDDDFLQEYFEGAR